MLVDMGLPLEVVAAVIGHEAGGKETRTLVRHYIRTDQIERKVQVLRAWDERLQAIVAGREQRQSRSSSKNWLVRTEVAKCLSVETGQTRSVNQSMSASGVKRTSACALHMSAFDPKRTLPDRSTTAFPVRLEPVRSTLAEL